MGLDKKVGVLLPSDVFAPVTTVTEGVIEIVTHHADPISLSLVSLSCQKVLGVSARLVLFHSLLLKLII